MYKKIRRILWKPIRHITLKWKNYPRYIIEKKIFPLIENDKVLLVGCIHFISHYPKLLEKGNNEVWSIDIDPEMAEFGAKNHIVGDVTELTKHFKKNSLNIIFLLGVIGYGLDNVEEIEKAMKSCYEVLRPGGILVITTKDYYKHQPKDLKNYKLFTPFSFDQTYNENNVVFEFLVKK